MGMFSVGNCCREEINITFLRSRISPITGRANYFESSPFDAVTLLNLITNGTEPGWARFRYEAAYQNGWRLSLDGFIGAWENKLTGKTIVFETVDGYPPNPF